MTAFFIPGVESDLRVREDAYEDMRKQVELDLGHRPTGRRIMRLWTRRGSVDCVTEVGRRDPLRGGTVIAIFDMGPHRPFVVWWLQDEQARLEILGPSAYAVSEFDA